MSLTRRKGLRRTAFKPRTAPVSSSARKDSGLNRSQPLRAKPWKPGAFSTLRPTSVKQAKRERKLAKIKAELIAERGPWCEMCRILARFRGQDTIHAAFASNDCDGIATDLHHVLPRSLGGRDVKTNLMLAGRAHHEWAERAENRVEAMAAGVLRGTPPVAHVEPREVPYDWEEVGV